MGTLLRINHGSIESGDLPFQMCKMVSELISIEALTYSIRQRPDRAGLTVCSNPKIIAPVASMTQ